MTELTSLIGYASGVLFIGPGLEPRTMLATVAAIHLCDAILCFFVARYGGRNPTYWTLAGLVFGVWATLPLLLRRRVTETQGNAMPES
ncbi:MAG: hypothetical protein OXF11_01935 [Deltaproteobacteria bacterium]|nr:hypothetical protein [Deltaproteobacteria bacterium]